MSKKAIRDKTKYLAKLVTENRKPCAFCQREVDDEIIYGKLYAIGDIQCHYFCVLLSCCLIQKGKDEEGLFGFLYQDILAEVERSKKHRCSYCSKDGASLGCSVSQCRKQFHLPCGRERNAMSLFYGNFKSFCKNHAPKQKVADNVMAKVKLRLQASRKCNKTAVKIVEPVADDDELKAETVCVICYEEVECCPTPQTFWPPCCARDAWFHRSCVQRMALSAGMHYLKCPLCNDKENFYQAVIGLGFYVPDRDASWELEQNAFAEIYSRELRCVMPTCLCPNGREHDTGMGDWDIKPCLLCGGSGAHAGCLRAPYVCAACAPAAPAAPADLAALARTIHTEILSEQVRASAAPRRLVMPSRMSLRRTKQRQMYYKMPSTSSQNYNESYTEVPSNTSVSRRELNIRSPKKPGQSTRPDRSVLRDIENKLFSPVKMIEQGLREKVKGVTGEELVLKESVVAEVRSRFRKPKPLSEKKKIVDGILEDLISNMLKENTKLKSPIRTWCSPKKEMERTSEEVQDDAAPTEQNIQEIKQEPSVNTIKKPIDSVDVKSGTSIGEISEYVSNNTEGDAIECIDSDNCESPKAHKDSGDSKILSPGVEIVSDSPEDTNVMKTEHDSIMTNEDDSSNSTFQLPPEFIAEGSDTSLPIFDTPKKLKTVEMQKDSSMEISENNDVVNIDVVKIENNESNGVDVYGKSEKCAFKFSPVDKESLVTNKMDIDLESFKSQYLNEVDRDFKCNFSHKHEEKPASSFQLQSAINFAIDATLKSEGDKCEARIAKKKSRKRRLSGIVLRYEDFEDTKKRKAGLETEVSIQNDSMRVKISLKKKKFKLKIMQSKQPKTPKSLKQYVLKYSDETKDIIGKPEKEVTPIKRKYVKQEKSPDNLIQTSIQSFFKGKSPNN